MADTPRADTPLGDTPLHSACWEIQATSGRYASYWNAILFVVLLFTLDNKNAFLYDVYRPLFTIRGVFARGSLSWRGGSLSRRGGSLSKGVSVQRGLCWGNCLWGSLSRFGLCRQVFVQEVSVQGDLCPVGVSGINMGLETETPSWKEHGTKYRESPRRNMGPGSQTGSDIIQRHLVNRMTHESKSITLPPTS